MPQTITFSVAMGDEVKDRVTGFQGIVTGLYYYFNRCQRVAVQPVIPDRALYKDAPEMRVPTAEVFDVEQLDIITANKVVQKVDRGPDNTNGPMPAPPARRI